MATPNRSEYLDLDGLPLATAAWETTNLEVLWAAADPRGDNDPTPFRRGRRARRHHTDSKRATLELVIFGAHDSDGDPAPGTVRAQLEANIDELKTGLRARQNIADGTVDSALHTPTKTLVGPAQIRTGLKLGPLGPGAARATVDVEFTDGVLYDETGVDVTAEDVDGEDDLVVPNPGSADQYALLVDLTGAASSITLTNLTWDPTADTWLEFGGALEDDSVGTQIDTDDFTAVRNDVNVVGLVTASGHERWLPLLAGVDNTIRIEPVGGLATVRIRHTPAYL